MGDVDAGNVDPNMMDGVDGGRPPVGPDGGVALDGGPVVPGEVDGGPPAPDVRCGTGDDVAVTGPIETDTTWSCEDTYVLTTPVFVSGAVLTIEAGTRIEAGGDGTLIVQADAELRAVGRAGAPIVFTSNAATPDRGDWGGIYMLGRAPTNRGTTELPPLGGLEGWRISHGGSNPGHRCGQLEYVRIEFPGERPTGTRERAAGLTLAACGRETRVRFLQVHGADDDGILIEGGTVDLDHIVISHPSDDGWDWGGGWTGVAQFVIVQGDGAMDEAIEGGNRPGDPRAAPVSDPLIANFTLVGDGRSGRANDAIRFHDGTEGVLTHGVIVGFESSVADVDGELTTFNASRSSPEGNEALRIEQSVFYDVGPPLFAAEMFPGDDAGFDEGRYFTDAVFENDTEVDPMLQDRGHPVSPDFRPTPGAPLDRGQPPTLRADRLADPSATYAGAIEPGGVDWTLGWTAYPAF